MENSDQLLFGSQTKKEWFIILEETWKGPFSAAEVYRKVMSHEWSWAHFMGRSDSFEWKRICDQSPFLELAPTPPSKLLQGQVREAILQHTREKTPELPLVTPLWYVYAQSVQKGPFHFSELKSLILSGQLGSTVSLWREGWEAWKPLSEVSEFSVLMSSPSPPKHPVHQRSFPRVPLVAKVLLTHGETVSMGLCRDVSLGGMQVLMEAPPTKMGLRLKLNISPAAKNPDLFEPFVAEGILVRVLEDGRGFSFRFDPLSPEAKKSLESYLSQKEIAA